MLRLKRERLALGWSQVALAFHAGMSIGDISRIENKRLQPYPRQLEKLSSVLRVDRRALLQDVSEEDAGDAGGRVRGHLEFLKPDVEWREQSTAVPDETARTAIATDR